MTSPSNPKVNQEVEIRYKISRIDNGEVVDSTKNKPPFSFILGEHKICQEIEDLILTMTKNEKKTIKLLPETCVDIMRMHGENIQKPEDNKIELEAEVELLDFYDKIKSIFEMDANERKEAAKKSKEEGVELFKKQQYKEASEKFTEAVNYISKLLPLEITEDIEKLKVSCMLNSANCYNKIKMYNETIKEIDKLVENTKDNPKAFYYRGTAYAMLDEFGKADEDYNELVKLMGKKDDPGAIAFRNLIDTRRNDKETKERGRMKNLFKKGIYDDKK